MKRVRRTIAAHCGPSAHWCLRFSRRYARSREPGYRFQSHIEHRRQLWTRIHPNVVHQKSVGENGVRRRRGLGRHAAVEDEVHRDRRHFAAVGRIGDDAVAIEELIAGSPFHAEGVKTIEDGILVIAVPLDSSVLIAVRKTLVRMRKRPAGPEFRDIILRRPPVAQHPERRPQTRAIFRRHLHADFAVSVRVGKLSVGLDKRLRVDVGFAARIGHVRFAREKLEIAIRELDVVVGDVAGVL